jgi:hypothetical protein
VQETLSRTLVKPFDLQFSQARGPNGQLIVAVARHPGLSKKRKVSGAITGREPVCTVDAVTGMAPDMPAIITQKHLQYQKF